MQNIDILKRRLAQNLDKLEAFALVGKHSSVSRAATEANLSQSALSHLIAKLENSLETELFVRRSHGLRLTDTGAVLFEFAKRLFIDVENLSARLCMSGSEAPVKIRVGTHETLAAHIWPKAIESFSKKKGGRLFALSTGRVDALVELLLRGDLHFIMSVEPKADPRIISRPLYKGQLRFYAGMNWRPLPSRSRNRELRVEDLLGVPVFTDVYGHTCQGTTIPQALASIGISDLGQFEIGSFEAAINMAAMNLGIAVIPDRNAAKAIREKRLRPLAVKNLKNLKSLSYQICVSYLSTSPRKALYEQTILELQKVVGIVSPG